MDWPVVLTIVIVLLAVFWWVRDLAEVVAVLFNRKVLDSSKIHGSQKRFIDTYSFPSSIDRKVSETYPYLSPEQMDKVFAGLREYFHICHQAGTRFVSMPSQVIDVAWHECIISTQAYEEYCQKAFGRFLHHTPAAALKSKDKGRQEINCRLAVSLCEGRD